MAPATDSTIIAAVARLEEAVSGVREVVIGLREETRSSISALREETRTAIAALRDDGKERRTETMRELEALSAKFDGLAIRLADLETTVHSNNSRIESNATLNREIDARLGEIAPHIEGLKSAKERKNVLWLPAIVTMIGSIVLVFGEAVWALIARAFHIGN